MEYVKQTLTAWLTEHANDEQFPDVVAGAPLIYATAATLAAAQELTTDNWYVTDIVGELPQIEQTSTTVDVSKTGSVAHELIKGVPDAPDAVSFPVPHVTDNTLDAVDQMVEDYETAKAGNLLMFFGYYRKKAKTQIFAGAPGKGGIAGGAFSDAFSDTISIVPDLTKKARVTIAAPSS